MSGGEACFMLQAKMKSGHLVTLAMLSRRKIESLRCKEKFYCPTCHEKVIIRAGPQTIPHFAHYRKTLCPSAEGGEGPYHEKGKMLLYQWLKKQKMNVTLEKYLPQISQRPDISLKMKQKEIAIEFQCARIPIKQLQQRNEGYLKLGIQPIWILGANQFTRTGPHHLKVDQFTLRFIHRFNSRISTSLYYFCPNVKQFLTASDLFFTRGKTAAVKFQFMNLDSMSFHDLFRLHSFRFSELTHLWTYEKKRFRIGKRITPRGRELSWRQWLYLKQIPIEHLPSVVYLPVPSQYLMKSPLWDWQSRICLDLIHPLKEGENFTVNDCFKLLQNHFHKEKALPLINHSKHPITEYLKLLQRAQIIQQVSSSQFKKLSPLLFFKNIEEAIRGDERFMKNLPLKTINKK